MAEIDFCPECGAPVVGDGSSQMCTSCGLMYDEMEELLDDDELQEDDEIDADDGLREDDEYELGEDSDGDGDDW
ncbi:MAG: hypothetical protein RLZZ544_507 [Actinomycetota bacterium]|jgi:DNA-directed RNA polymerase subunit M/transcription elongation factor TFIIS|nr:hypothetical protein [Actinomycetota bacterium]